MLKRANMETRRSAGFPADLLALLMLPAFAILAILFGAQRTWLLLVLIGVAEIPAGLFLLRGRRSSVSGWFALALGLIALAAGIRFALTRL